MAAVSAISSTQVVIIGGEYYNENCHSDVIIFDDEDRIAIQIAEAGFSFQCWSQTVTDNAGVLYSLVNPSHGNRCLIKFSAADN